MGGLHASPSGADIANSGSLITLSGRPSRTRAERRGSTRAIHEDSGQGVQGARRSDRPGGVRGEPSGAAARPTRARDQDTDLEFDTVFFGRKVVESVQGPVFWVTGSGSLDDFKLLVSSKIQTEPLDLSRPFPQPNARRPEPIESSQENTKIQ
jgi:hypothetical protein